MRTVIVRRRTDSDLDACIEMCLLVHQRDGYPVYLPNDLGAYLFPADVIDAWVAEEAGEIVGHIALHRSALAPMMALASQALGRPVDRLGVVARLFVAVGGRRHGTGRALLDVAWAESWTRGLWPVLDVFTGFHGAIGLYESRGWTRAGLVTIELPDLPAFDEFVYLGPERGLELGPVSHPEDG
jgi:GNAT superfamily N-acetyltransferase